jgi:hypothetical protein
MAKMNKMEYATPVFKMMSISCGFFDSRRLPRPKYIHYVVYFPDLIRGADFCS